MENILDKLNRDLKKASENLSDREARYLVDLYYQMQDFRIQATNQTRILTREDAEEPHEVIGFMGGNYKTIEDNIKACLKVYGEQTGRKMDAFNLWHRASYCSRTACSYRHQEVRDCGCYMELCGTCARCRVVPGAETAMECEIKDLMLEDRAILHEGVL